MQAKLVTDEYDPLKAKRALRMLLINRSNEFREIAYAMGYPIHIDKEWEEFILRFCLEFDGCFKMWSSGEDQNAHNQIHKCMIMMRQIARGKSNITRLQSFKMWQWHSRGFQDNIQQAQIISENKYSY